MLAIRIHNREKATLCSNNSRLTLLKTVVQEIQRKVVALRVHFNNSRNDHNDRDDRSRHNMDILSRDRGIIRQYFCTSDFLVGPMGVRMHVC